MMITNFVNALRTPRPRLLTRGYLRRQALAFRGSRGVSEENRTEGFSPAFLDTETGAVYPARFADGRAAPMHVLDGLPEELIVARDGAGSVTAVKATVTAGFMHGGRFFTRQQAARAIAVRVDMQAPSASEDLM